MKEEKSANKLQTTPKSVPYSADRSLKCWPKWSAGFAGTATSGNLLSLFHVSANVRLDRSAYETQSKNSQAIQSEATPPVVSDVQE